MENLENHFINILQGNAILFVGAGFSYENRNIYGKKIPSSSELTKALHNECGLSDSDSSYNLSVISEYFIENFGKSKLIDFLKENFIVNNAEEWQKKLVELPWYRIYTTNYDNVLETASNQVSLHRKPIDIGKNPSLIRDLEHSVVHLNGFIDEIDETNIESSTKLTNISYSDTQFINGPWYTEILDSFNYAKSIIFIGFSMSHDLDLRRLVTSQELLREKIVYINGKLDPIESNLLSKYGNIIGMTGKQFTDKLIIEKGNFIPTDDDEIRTFSFIKCKNNCQHISVNNHDVSDFFITGNFDENKLFYNYKLENYCIYREKIDTIINNLHKFNLFTVLSYLGNGKTIFLKLLERELMEKNYTVFKYTNNKSKIYDDIQKLNNIKEDNCVILIDDYYSIRDSFKYFTYLDNKKFTLVITGRTALNDNNIDSFKNCLNLEDEMVCTINIDSLCESELRQISHIIDYNNLWGTWAGKSKKEKNNYISKMSKKGLGTLIFDLMKSQNILNKYFDVYTNLDKTSKQIVQTLLISNILGTNLSAQDILLLTGNSVINDSVRDNVNIREFIDISRDKLLFKSSLASRELIKFESNRTELVELLDTILKNAIKFDLNDKYMYLKRQLISFSNFTILNEVTSEEELNNLAVKYYEKIQNYSFTKENQFFWLQFGIQRLHEKKYELADKYFDNALSYAKKSGMKDFYQINAQKARGIVESTILKVKNTKEALEKMNQAHKLLMADLKHPKNNKSYQLSQGILYRDFYNRFKSEFKDNQITIFKMMVKQFEKEIDAYLNKNSNNKLVKESKIHLTKLHF